MFILLKHVPPVEMDPTERAKNYFSNFWFLSACQKIVWLSFASVPEEKFLKIRLTSFQTIVDSQSRLPQFDWISKMEINL